MECYDDKETRQEEGRKNEVWLPQQLEGELAMQRADRAVEPSSRRAVEPSSRRAVELLKHLSSDKGYERKLSILLSLAFASQNQLSDGIVPVLVQAGMEDAEFREDLKYALLNLKDEAEKGADSGQCINSKDSDLIGEELQKFASAESTQSGEIASQSELFRISREVLSPEKRDRIFESGIRLVIAINRPEQKAGAEARAERLAPLFSTQSEKRNFRFVIENARDAGAEIPATPEIRVRQSANSKEIPETVKKIQDSLRGKLDFKSVGLPETQVAEGEFETWLGDGQTLRELFPH